VGGGGGWEGAEHGPFGFLKGLGKCYSSNNDFSPDSYFKLVTSYLLTLFSVCFQPHHV